jgi:hypothetical protein
VQYTIRGGKLDAFVTMRSSDWFLGIPYDWWMQSRLQMTMAWALGCPPGTFTWMAGSQHIYERNFDDARKIAGSAIAEVEQPPAIMIPEHETETAARRVECVQQLATDIVMARELKTGDPLPALWHAVLVPQLPGAWRACDWCRYISEMWPVYPGKFCFGCNGEDTWKHG